MSLVVWLGRNRESDQFAVTRTCKHCVTLYSVETSCKNFDELFAIGEAGPPAYLVFNNVNYSDPNNIALMSQMQIELAQLN